MRRDDPLVARPAMPAAGPPGGLPAPPWADQDARHLPALPATAPPRRLAPVLVLAFLVCRLAAAAGYFGVLAIARLG
jgi:hypothetical protein